MAALYGLGEGVPIYSTREDCDGIVGTIRIPAWLGLLITILASVNAILWGVVGIIAAVRALV